MARSITCRRIIAVLVLAALAGCQTTGSEPPSLEALRTEAKAGDARSQYELGLRYLNGYGVKEDHAVAADWFKQSAGQGDPDAAYMLGIAYYTGRGIPKDAAYAVTWFEAAAADGHVHARYQLGDAYANGRGVRKEPAWAVRWFESAARAGHAGAQFSMGVIYATGLGVRRDPAEAWVWMSLAEGTGHSQARKVRLRIEEEMGRGARTQAEREARRFQVLPPRVADDQARTRYAQSGLARLGYNAGPADGVSGPKTRSALADFRRAAGSGGNGPLSDEDVDKIRRHLNQSL